MIATVPSWSDGDHMLAHGIVSHVNASAAALGCAVGQSVRDCAERMKGASVPLDVPPPITDGARFVIRDEQGRPVLICADSIGMVVPEDTGRIVVTASHGALPGGRSDTIVPLGVRGRCIGTESCRASMRRRRDRGLWLGCG